MILAVMWPVDSKFSWKIQVTGDPKAVLEVALPIPCTRRWASCSPSPGKVASKLASPVLGKPRVLSWSYPETGSSSILLDCSSNRFEILRAKFSGPGSQVGETSLCGTPSSSLAVPTGMSGLGAGPALRWATRKLREKWF